MSEVSNRSNGNDIYMDDSNSSMTAELMSNDTKFVPVDDAKRREKGRRKPFHTLDRVLRAA